VRKKPLTEEELRRAVAEGLKLRAEIERRIAPMRRLTAEDLGRVCRRA
jgi:hypothetical protein